MDVGQVLTIALGVIGAFGGGYAYFRKSAGDSTIKYQADALGALDKERESLKTQNAALASENATLKEQNAKLWDKAQGSPQLVELTQQIKELVSVVTSRGKRK